MKPIKYTTVDTNTTFHYKYHDIKKFLKRGFEYGDCGWILVRQKGTVLTYKGFGTIENPNRNLITINIKHIDLFDGKLKTPEEIIHPKETDYALDNYRMIFIENE